MSYGRTLHVLCTGCLPATLIIIPYRHSIVNHKFAISAKKLANRLSCVQNPAKCFVQSVLNAPVLPEISRSLFQVCRN